MEVAVIIRPNDGFSHFLLGLTYLKTGRPAQAVEEARRAITLAPREPGLHFGFASILEATGDLTGAREKYRAELAVRHDHQPSPEKLHESISAWPPPADFPGARKTTMPRTDSRAVV